MGLTDKALEIVLGVLLLVLLWFLAEQELTLRHDKSTITTKLNVERQCRVGSVCAQKLEEESARGAAMAGQARADADAAIAARKDALDKQANDAIQGLAASTLAAQKEALTWKQKYQRALQTPDCNTWAKQAVVCTVR